MKIGFLPALNQNLIMKSLLLSLMLSLTNVNTTQAQDDNISFRNINWGVHIDSIYRDNGKVEMIRDKSSLIRNAFYINNDPLFIGNVRLNKVNYIFNDENRFFRVFIQGPKEDAEQMRFILNYKFGDSKNRSTVDGMKIEQWFIKDVSFTLKEYDHMKFELSIESNWQASDAYRKNTSVDDF
jgi:hypothetical protein